MRTDNQLNDHLKVEGLWNSTRYLDSARKLAVSSFSGGERDHLFLNEGTNQFRDVGAVSGLDAPGDGRVFVHWDYDRDGWQDLAVASTNYPLLNLYRNQLGDTHGTPRFVALRFVGGSVQATPTPGLSNRDGIGARVTARLGDRTLLRERSCGEGLAAQNSSTLLIGLGDREAADTLTVDWPSGKTTTASNVPTGTLITFYEDPAVSPDGSGYRFEPYVVKSTAPQSPAELPRIASPGQSLPLAHRDGSESSRVNVYTSMASWCQACKQFLPQLKQLRDEMDGGDLSLYGVPIDLEDTPQVLDLYVTQHRPAYELLTQLSDADRTSFQDFVRDQLHTDALPATVVATADGRVLATVAGVPTVSEIRRLLESIE